MSRRRSEASSGVPLRLGTRGSALARAQAETVAAALDAAGWPVELVTIRTAGDDHGPDLAWGEGAFVTAIEGALRAGTIDLAVHSAKDLPTDEPDDLAIGAMLPRADPRDALVTAAPGGHLATLPVGARVGTDSPRRSGFLRRLRPDLAPHPLNGNVDRRLARLDGGETDALVLAVAGLERLGRSDRIGEVLDPRQVPPAAGQGAIAVQIRHGGGPAQLAARALDDRPTHRAVRAERAFLRAMGGGCRSPMGAWAEDRGAMLTLAGGWVSPDGRDARFGGLEGDPAEPDRLGAALASLLGAMPAAAGPTVLVTRPDDQAGPLEAALAALGVRSLRVPAIGCRPLASTAALDAAAARSLAFERIVLTSGNGAVAFLAACRRTGQDPRVSRWAVVGEGSAASLRAVGATDVWTSPEPNAAGLGGSLPFQPGALLLVVQGDRAGSQPAAALEARGARVETVCAYHTEEGPPGSLARLRRGLAAGPPDAIVFTSGSTVRGLARLLAAAGASLLDVPAVCIGAETAATARAHGFVSIRVTPQPTTAALAELAAEAARR